MYIRFLKSGEIDTYAQSLSPEMAQDPQWTDRWAWKDFATVEKIAAHLTEKLGYLWLPVDRTESTSPRYDVMVAPRVGDKVSRGFNGDYYPDGEIVKITPTFQIKTSNGHTFRRVKNTSTWIMSGGTWGLVSGHIDERNPHF